MRITDLMTRLKVLHAVHGDLEVVVMDKHSYEMEDVTAIGATTFPFPDQDEKAATILY